jgi:hypothetical protein
MGTAVWQSKVTMKEDEPDNNATNSSDNDNDTTKRGNMSTNDEWSCKQQAHFIHFSQERHQIFKTKNRK